MGDEESILIAVLLPRPKAIVKTDEQARVKNGIYFALPVCCFAHEDTSFSLGRNCVNAFASAGHPPHPPESPKMLERSVLYDPDHRTGFFQHAGAFSDQQLDAVVDRTFARSPAR